MRENEDKRGDNLIWNDQKKNVSTIYFSETPILVFRLYYRRYYCSVKAFRNAWNVVWIIRSNWVIIISVILNQSSLCVGTSLRTMRPSHSLPMPKSSKPLIKLIQMDHKNHKKLSTHRSAPSMPCAILFNKEARKKSLWNIENCHAMLC